MITKVIKYERSNGGLWLTKVTSWYVLGYVLVYESREAVNH